MKYSLTFGRNSQLIWALILPAFILLFPLLYILDYALTTYPDQGDIIVIVGAILYSVSYTHLDVYKRQFQF